MERIWVKLDLLLHKPYGLVSNSLPRLCWRPATSLRNCWYASAVGRLAHPADIVSKLPIMDQVSDCVKPHFFLYLSTIFTLQFSSVNVASIKVVLLHLNSYTWYLIRFNVCRCSDLLTHMNIFCFCFCKISCANVIIQTSHRCHNYK